jgi:glutathione S-transferase
MLRIWGRMSSINVRKVVWTVQALGLTHQRTDAGGQFGIVQTPDYLAQEPERHGAAAGGWPVHAVGIQCDRALPVRQTFRWPALPGSLEGRFDAERWMDWQQTTLNPAGRDAFVQLIRKPGGQVDAAKVNASIAATEPLLDLLDAHLARQPFMAGSTLTMADIPVACEIHRWRGLPLARKPRPHLEHWYQQMLAHPASPGVLDLTLS